MPARRRLRVLACPTVVGILLLPAGAGAQEHTLAQASWFEGCWERVTGTRRRVERWDMAANGVMRGDSRSFNDSTETGGERLRLELVDGKLTYFAHPSNQAPQSFTATTISPTGITFENLAHDFPQRIVYERRGADSLVARVEGDRAGRQQPITFAFRRMSCDGHVRSPVDLAQEALAPRYEDLARRLREHPSATPAWFVAHALPSFAYMHFAAPGYLGRLGSLRTQEAAARAVAAAAAPALTDYTVGVEVASALVRGDTADVMVVIRQSARTGPAGAQRLRATEQRRLDRWVRVGGEWRLASAMIVNEETALDGVLSLRNGASVVR